MNDFQFPVLQTQRKVASAKSEYEKIHQRLMNELPQLYEKRIDLFDPCLTAMMSSQVCRLSYILLCLIWLLY